MSDSDPATPSGRPLRTWRLAAMVLGLMAVLSGQLLLSSRRESQTWNEAYHLWAGYRYWQARDFGVNPEHPPLAKWLAALPILPLTLHVPPVPRGTSKREGNVAAREFLYSNDTEAMLFRARLAVGLFTFVLALLVFEAAYRMFGARAALLALLLTVFEPNLLAHGMLVTTDAPLACCLLASVVAFYRYVRKPSALQLVECGFTVGLALAVKHSGILAVPILALLALAEAVLGPQFGPGPSTGSQGARPDIARRALRIVAPLLLVFAVAVAVLWACYSFRFAARPDRQPMTPPLQEFVRGLKSPLETRALLLLARGHVLPESYLYGLADVLMVSAGPRPSFILGRLYPHGRWFYFPVAFLIKSTLGFLLLLALAKWAPALRRPKLRRESLYLLVPPVLFLGVSMTSGLNLGVRHILPIYPFLLILAGAVGSQLAERSQRVGWRIAVGALVLFHIVSSLRAFPNYLAYSNEIFGGPEKTYHVLTDSNVDWGQGLKEARAYLARRHITDCWLAYFGSADPDYYHLPCKLLPDPLSGWWGKPVAVAPSHYSGTVMVSATEGSGAYTGPGELNPYDEFMQTPPAANIGGSILVYEGRFDMHLVSALSHVNKAWELDAAHKLDVALAEARMAAALAPRAVMPHFALGYLLSEKKQTAEARAEYQTALRLANTVLPEYQWYWIPFIEQQLKKP